MSPRRSATILLTLLIFLGWFAWLRPTALGGPATFIIVNGTSMEPAYHRGDLVVLHKEPDYAFGDIVAYPMDPVFHTGRLVIHRIVAQDPDGFITQGDNRDVEDNWRATDANIRGSAWFHVPKVGLAVSWLQNPWRIASLATLLFLIGGAQQAETYRRRRHRMKRHFGNGGNWLPDPAQFSSYQSGLLALATGAGVLALGFLVLGVIAFSSASRSAEQTSVPEYTESGSFDYAIFMEPSTLYPDGVLQSGSAAPTGAPDAGADASPPAAFTSLTREAKLSFNYALDSDDAVDMTGTVAANLVIRPAGGEWSRTTPLLAPTPFEGTTATAPISIDLVAVGALINQIEDETGLSGRSYELMVNAHVTATGTRAGEPFETTFESPFTLTYDPVLITPPSTLTTTTPTTATKTIVRPKSLSLGFWSPRVSSARAVAMVGFSAMLGLLLMAGGYLALGLRNDEEARIRARYGSRLVSVAGPETERTADAVRVATMRDLARLAERFGSVILHAPLPEGHRYFVRDGEDTYEYFVGSDEPVIGRTVTRPNARKS